MNKILTKVTALCVGLAMVAGVGVAVGSKKASAAHADSVTLTQADFSSSWTTTQGEQSGTAQGFTLATTSGLYNSAHLRQYSGATLTLSSTVGKMTQVVFTCTANGTNNYGPGKMSGNGYVASSGKTGTWTGNADSFSLTGGQARITSIEITYTASAEPGLFLEKNSMWLVDEGSAKSVTYTTSNFSSTPSVAVSGTPNYVDVSVSAGSISISPKSIGTETLTFVATQGTQQASASLNVKVYDKHGLVEDDPFTVAEAREAIDNGGPLESVYVRGIISQIDTPSSFSGQICYYISDDGSTTNQFEIYWGRNIGNVNFDSVKDIALEATVVNHGNIKKYNSTYEFDSGSYLISYTAPAATDYSVSFNGNGASGSMSGTSTHGDYTLPANGFYVPSGKVFAGWKAGNDGDLIAAGTTYSVSADVVFYAQWADICTVTYTAGANGSGSYVHSNQPAGSYSLLPFTSLEDISPADGYRFKNYTVSGTDYAAGTEITISGTTAVTVNFEEIPSAQNVTFDFSQIEGFSSWGNSYSTPHEVNYTQGTVTFESACKQTQTITNIPVTKGAGPVTFVAAQGVTIYEASFVLTQWTTKEKTVELWYSTDGGSNYTSTTITSSNFSISDSNLPAGTNAIKLTFSETSNQVGIASLTIVYAGGVDPSSGYTVSYNANGGTGTMTDSNSPYTGGATVTVLENKFEKSGYTFTNWNTAADGSGIDYVKDDTFTISANTTLYAIWQENGGGGSSIAKRCYSLVTSADDLVAGAKYIIVGGSSYAMSSTQGNNNRGRVEIAVSGTVASVTSDAVEVVTLGGSTGVWTFEVSAGGYLYAASSSKNYLRTQSTNDANGEWAIVFGEEGAATVTAQGSNTRNVLRYNSSDSLFSAYASGQSAVYLYRLDFGETLLGNITCDGNGSYTFADGFAWSDLKSVYQSLPSGEQSSLKTASNDGLTRYDYLIAKYGESVFENFIDRSITPLPNAAYILDYQSNIDSSSSITIIVIVTVTSMTLLGVTLVLRKRKHQ